MPIYEYACRACGHQLDELQSFSDKPLKRCPKCGKNTLEKLVSAPGIQFKGSGWYLTDYSQKGKAKDSTSKETDTKPAKSDKVEKSEKTTKAKEKNEK
ncbi:MAG: zinc ribbon domain-containing protein [Proteobacteria bacterium]|nr:zinc ribbon domain-containing protein [Pseudomonadota bacterium]